jgi:hypothetical protein
MPRTAATDAPKALANAAKFAVTPPPPIAIADCGFKEGYNHLASKDIFCSIFGTMGCARKEQPTISEVSLASRAKSGALPTADSIFSSADVFVPIRPRQHGNR